VPLQPEVTGSLEASIKKSKEKIKEEIESLKTRFDTLSEI
jgi:hypothetical protein